jgi:uncharacterized protein YgbK (DUF1537 family)
MRAPSVSSSTIWCRCSAGRRAHGWVSELATIEDGPRAIAARFAELARAGQQVAIVDALFDRHLDVVAEASAGLRLITGGATLGGALGAHQLPWPRGQKLNRACRSVRLSRC